MGQDSTWKEVVVQLLKILPEVGNFVPNAIMQAFEKGRRKSASKDRNLLVIVNLFCCPTAG